MKKIIITNNDKVNHDYGSTMNVLFLEDASYLDILKIIRDKVHEGYRLLTHPLSGSVKPNETPFKSVAISEEKSSLDMQSLEIIEDCLRVAERFIAEKKPPVWTERVLDDFRLIDYGLIKGAIDSMDQFK